MTRTQTVIAASLTLAGLVAATAQVSPQSPARPRASNRLQSPALVKPVKKGPIPWSLAAGRPNINVTSAPGFYIWHEGNEVFIASAGDTRQGRTFSGNAQVRGRVITNPRGLNNEKQDKFTQISPNRINFRFETYEATDGVRFRLTDEQVRKLKRDRDFLSVSLQIEGRKTGKVYIGQRAIDVNRDPVVFNLNK